MSSDGKRSPSNEVKKHYLEQSDEHEGPVQVKRKFEESGEPSDQQIWTSFGSDILMSTTNPVKNEPFEAQSGRRSARLQSINGHGHAKDLVQNDFTDRTTKETLSFSPLSIEDTKRGSDAAADQSPSRELRVLQTENKRLLTKVDNLEMLRQAHHWSKTTPSKIQDQDEARLQQEKQHQRDLQRVTAEHDKYLAELETTHRQQLDDLESQLEDVEREKESLTRNMVKQGKGRQAIEEANVHLKNDIKALKKEAGKFDKKQKTTTDKADSAVRKLKTEITELKKTIRSLTTGKTKAEEKLLKVGQAAELQHNETISAQRPRRGVATETHTSQRKVEELTATNQGLRDQIQSLQAAMHMSREESNEHLELEAENLRLKGELYQLRRPKQEILDTDLKNQMTTIVCAIRQWVVKHLLRGLKVQAVADLEDLSLGTQAMLKTILPWMSSTIGVTCEHLARALIAGHILVYFSSSSLTPSFFPAISFADIVKSFQGRNIDQKAIEEWRASTSRLIYSMNDDELAIAVSPDLEGSTSQIVSALNEMLDITISHSAIEALKTVLFRAIKLSHDMRCQKAIYTLAWPQGRVFEPMTMLDQHGNERARDGSVVQHAIFPVFCKVTEPDEDETDTQSVVSKGWVVCNQ